MWNGKNVPVELLEMETTSDIISDDEYEIDAIRPRTSLQDHKVARHQFQVEGIKPFFRHTMVSESRV